MTKTQPLGCQTFHEKKPLLEQILTSRTGIDSFHFALKSFNKVVFSACVGEALHLISLYYSSDYFFQQRQTAFIDDMEVHVLEAAGYALTTGLGGAITGVSLFLLRKESWIPKVTAIVGCSWGMRAVVDITSSGTASAFACLTGFWTASSAFLKRR